MASQARKLYLTDLTDEQWSIVDSTSRSDDFIRPGHIFPLIARPGGILERDGHTEAAVDLARLAGLSPAGVLCEICSRDSLNMADRDELLELGARLARPLRSAACGPSTGLHG